MSTGCNNLYVIHLDVQTIDAVMGGGFLHKLSSGKMTELTMTFLYSRLFPSDTYPVIAVSFENIWRWQFMVYLKPEV